MVFTIYHYFFSNSYSPPSTSVKKEVHELERKYSYPVRSHRHLKPPPGSSSQTPPCRHRSRVQTAMRASQSVPLKPSGQRHRTWPDWSVTQVPPLEHAWSHTCSSQWRPWRPGAQRHWYSPFGLSRHPPPSWHGFRPFTKHGDPENLFSRVYTATN
jgi:hypothetical protein